MSLWIGRLFVIFLGCAAFYFAAQVYLHPDAFRYAIEKRIIGYVGNAGLIVAWILAGTGCFWSAAVMKDDDDEQSSNPQDKTEK